jgi:hypothetical protein
VALDEKNRLEVMLGNFPGIDNQTRLIRRYRGEAQRRRDHGRAELQRLQDEADDVDDDAWLEQLRRKNGGSLFPRPPAESAGAGPTPPPRPEAAEKPVPAADAGADPTPAVPRVETPANPQAAESSPRPGQGDGSQPVSIGRGPQPQPPRATPGVYRQTAAHRTLQ